METVKQENEMEVKAEEENCCEQVEEIVVAEMSTETTVTYSSTTTTETTAVTFEEIAAEGTDKIYAKKKCLKKCL